MVRINQISFAVAMGLFLALPGPANSQEQASSWSFGIGTGLKRQNVDGEIGFTSSRGPETGDIDLAPDNFDDLMDSAAGFVLSASKDKIRINASFQQVRLLDESTTVIADPLPPLVSSFQQDISQADVSVNYRLAVKGRNVWGLQGGVRWTEHDYDVRIGIGSAQTLRTITESWMDAVVAVTYARVVNQKLVWASRLGAGAGDSESYWNFNTSLNWQTGSHWTTSLFIDYMKIDFENDSPGDPAWYKYKADEWGPGLGFLYTFGGS